MSAASPGRRRFRRALIVLPLLPLLAVGLFSHLMTMGAPLRGPVPVPEGFPAGERFEVPAADGVTIVGHHFPGRIATAPVALFVHGIYHDRFQEKEKILLALKLGLSACVFDLRAHGESGGSLQTTGLHEARDLAAVVAWLARAGRTRVIGHGYSLGAAACAHYLAAGGTFEALVLQAPFANHERTIRLYAKRWYWIPDFLSPLVTATLSFTAWRIGAQGAEMDPADLVDRVVCPTLVVAGADDPRAPVADAREILERLDGEKELAVIPGCGHTGFTGHAAFLAALESFYVRYGVRPAR